MHTLVLSRYIFSSSPILMTLQQKVLIGVPGLVLSLIAGVAFAQTGSVSSSSSVAADPQACSAAVSAQNPVLLRAMDSRTAAEKTAMIAHSDALVAALRISDVSEREAAIQEARKTFQDAMREAMERFQEDTKDAREALQSCRGLGIGFPGGGRMGMMHGDGRGRGFGKGLGERPEGFPGGRGCRGAVSSDSDSDSD